MNITKIMLGGPVILVVCVSGASTTLGTEDLNKDNSKPIVNVTDSTSLRNKYKKGNFKSYLRSREMGTDTLNQNTNNINTNNINTNNININNIDVKTNLNNKFDEAIENKTIQLPKKYISSTTNTTKTIDTDLKGNDIKKEPDETGVQTGRKPYRSPRKKGNGINTDVNNLSIINLDTTVKKVPNTSLSTINMYQKPEGGNKQIHIIDLKSEDLSKVKVPSTVEEKKQESGINDHLTINSKRKIDKTANEYKNPKVDNKKMVEKEDDTKTKVHYNIGLDGKEKEKKYIYSGKDAKIVTEEKNLYRRRNEHSTNITGKKEQNALKDTTMFIAGKVSYKKRNEQRSTTTSANLNTTNKKEDTSSNELTTSTKFGEKKNWGNTIVKYVTVSQSKKKDPTTFDEKGQESKINDKRLTMNPNSKIDEITKKPKDYNLSYNVSKKEEQKIKKRSDKEDKKEGSETSNNIKVVKVVMRGGEKNKLQSESLSNSSKPMLIPLESNGFKIESNNKIATKPEVNKNPRYEISKMDVTLLSNPNKRDREKNIMEIQKNEELEYDAKMSGFDKKRGNVDEMKYKSLTSFSIGPKYSKGDVTMEKLKELRSGINSCFSSIRKVCEELKCIKLGQETLNDIQQRIGKCLKDLTAMLTDLDDPKDTSQINDSYLKNCFDKLNNIRRIVAMSQKTCESKKLSSLKNEYKNSNKRVEEYGSGKKFPNSNLGLSSCDGNNYFKNTSRKKRIVARKGHDEKQYSLFSNMPNKFNIRKGNGYFPGTVIPDENSTEDMMGGMFDYFIGRRWKKVPLVTAINNSPFPGTTIPYENDNRDRMGGMFDYFTGKRWKKVPLVTTINNSPFPGTVIPDENSTEDRMGDLFDLLNEQIAKKLEQKKNIIGDDEK